MCSYVSVLFFVSILSVFMSLLDYLCVCVLLCLCALCVYVSNLRVIQQNDQSSSRVEIRFSDLQSTIMVIWYKFSSSVQYLSNSFSFTTNQYYTIAVDVRLSIYHFWICCVVRVYVPSGNTFVIDVCVNVCVCVRACVFQCSYVNVRKYKSVRVIIIASY